MTSTVPFADLSRQWTRIAGAALPDLERLFASSAFCLGPWVERFERAVADYLGVGHAIGVNSGTSALHLAMIAAGIGPGDRVLVPSHTFIASAWGIAYVGAIPVLCDVRRDCGTIDLADAERRMTADVKAIVPVHLYGQPCDMEAVNAFAAGHGLTVIEDACQAIGACRSGKRVGTLGKLGCFSFYPGKNLGAGGEGGLVVTDDDGLARRIRALRVHGQAERYIHGEIGYNYRMEGIQGLVLGHKLPLIEAWTDERRAIARRYQDGLAGLPLELPQPVNGDHVWHLYVVRHERRDALKTHLQSQRIETGLHYPVALHRQPALARYDHDPSTFSESDRWADRCLSLPVFVGMTDAEVTRVIAGVRSFFTQEKSSP